MRTRLNADQISGLTSSLESLETYISVEDSINDFVDDQQDATMGFNLELMGNSADGLFNYYNGCLSGQFEFAGLTQSEFLLNYGPANLSNFIAFNNDRLQESISNINSGGGSSYSVTISTVDSYVIGLSYSDNILTLSQTGSGDTFTVSIAGSSAFYYQSTAPTGTIDPGSFWFNSTDGDLLVYIDDGTSQQWVMPAGPINFERRSDFQTPYVYCGEAPVGASESTPVWEISRITINIDGTTLTESAVGSWTNRYSLTYT
jgi:hypothetical protein